MRTLNLEQAAAFLHMHPYTVMQKVHTGEIPAAKPGKRWVFIEDDLADYLRGQYRAPSPLIAATSLPPKSAMTRTKPPLNAGIEKSYMDALGLVDCPQIHSPKPGARSGASHVHAARRVA